MATSTFGGCRPSPAKTFADYVCLEGESSIGDSHDSLSIVDLPIDDSDLGDFLMNAFDSMDPVDAMIVMDMPELSI